LAATGQTQPAAVSRLSPITGGRRVFKRIFDVVVAALLLLLLAPVILILALLIRLQDPGPAFYRRRVVGPGGDFDAFKLRTMRPDADHMLARDPLLRREFEVNFKLKNDPRITILGAWLRRLSLDELPQLWNVLRGDMSLVGPRMITPVELERYGDAAWIFRSVKPGLTGYWQIQRRRDVSYDERIAMDLHYVENWSLAFDFRILVKTPWRALRGRGAY
jgi:lipopolysaccharide/colanic/teichoic acid biosynthesis glycosyltransferase